MTTLIDAARQALEALDNLARYADTCELFFKETHPGKAHSLRERVTNSMVAIASLRQALSEAQLSVNENSHAIEQAEKQEPVAWCVLEPWLSGKFEAQDCFSDVALDANVGWVPLYTTPQPHPAPVQREHITDGSQCWCEPETDYIDPETGVAVIVHKEPQ